MRRRHDTYDDGGPLTGQVDQRWPEFPGGDSRQLRDHEQVVIAIHGEDGGQRAHFGAV
jgi:hypothetical protein